MTILERIVSEQINWTVAQKVEHVAGLVQRNNRISGGGNCRRLRFFWRPMTRGGGRNFTATIGLFTRGHQKERSCSERLLSEGGEMTVAASASYSFFPLQWWTVLLRRYLATFSHCAVLHLVVSCVLTYPRQLRKYSRRHPAPRCARELLAGWPDEWITI